MSYDTSGPPQEGGIRLAGWLPGATGLVFFATEDQAIAWLHDRNGRLIEHRAVFLVQFASAERFKLVAPPGPYLKLEG